MKKADLKTGMIVELNCGHKEVVMIGIEHNYSTVTDFIVSKDNKSWNSLSYYDNDMIYEGEVSHSWTISKVFKPNHPHSLFHESGEHGYTLIWERKEEIVLKLDGVEYSESTLRSLIKKATQ